MLNCLVDIPRCRPLLLPLLQTQFARTCNTYRDYSSATSLSDELLISDDSFTLLHTKHAQSPTTTENKSQVASQNAPHATGQKNHGRSWVEESVVSSDETSQCTSWVRPRKLITKKPPIHLSPSTRVRKLIFKKPTIHMGGYIPPSARAQKPFTKKPTVRMRGLISHSTRVRWGKPWLKVEKKMYRGWREQSWKPVKPDKEMDRPHFVSLGSWLRGVKGLDSGLTQQSAEALLQSPKPAPWNSEISPKSAEASPEILDMGLEQFDSRWFFRISRLLHGHKVHIPMTPHIAYFLSRYAGIPTRNALRARNLQKPPNNNMLWQETALWCLQRSPMIAMRLLINTLHGRSRPPRSIVAECLHFLARYYLHKVTRPGTHALKSLWHLTSRFIERDDIKNLRTYTIPESLTRLLLNYCHDDGVLVFYKRLSTNRVVLHAYTMMHFLERFVEMGRYDLCLSLLSTISSTGSSLAHPELLGLCAKLLRVRWEVKEPYALSSWILTQMLELGIQPNTRMYNAMLQNAVEAHDFETVLQLYDFAKRSQFGINSLTRGLMLKAAKLSGNVKMLNIVLHEAIEDPDVVKDARVVEDILHIICIFSPGDEYPSMLEFYKRHFDLRPLQELRLCGPETKSLTGTEIGPIQPDYWILGQMVAAYNKLPWASEDLITRYNIYHDLVRQNHFLIAPLAQFDYVANSFIRAFGRELRTLPLCVTVIKHMLEAPPSPAQSCYAAPTVRTWNILAASYFRHNQAVAAEKVLSMMHERGLEPNAVTRNTMVWGYSRLQDVESAVNAVKRMEAAGYGVDDFTLKGLGRIWDRNRLLEALKKSESEDQAAKRESRDFLGLLPLEDANFIAKNANVLPESAKFMAKGE